jgi:hypothetical protein
MAVKRTRPYDRYRHPRTVRALPGTHGELSAQIERSPSGWYWQALEGGEVFEHGEISGLDDAKRRAIFHINRLLDEQGASGEHLTENPDNWIGQDRPKSLSQQLKVLRPQQLRW